MNETGDMDAFAAEYVLGTLESGERAQALALMTIDPGFVDKIRLWERRLSELHLMVEPIEPDAKIWERIKGKFPAVTQNAAMQLPETEAPETEAPKTEAPTTSEAAEDATPSGVFDDLPTPTPATAAATMPAAPQLPSFLTPQAPTPAVAPPPTPAATPAPAPKVAAPLIPERAGEPRAPAAEPRGHVGLWRTIAAVMTLIVIAVATLVAAWRFAPDRLPAALQPVETLRRLGIDIPTGPPSRKPPPPESYFDE